MKPIKTILFMAACAILFFQCAEEAQVVQHFTSYSSYEAPADRMTWEEAMSQYKVDSEKFVIDPLKDTLIHCNEGTKIFIPANSMRTASGDDVKGRVKVRVKECYGLHDFLGENLTTTSDGKLLESGGTVHIEASCNGKAVEMKDEEQFMIYFPREKEKKGMETFYGERTENGDVNWKLAESDVGNTSNDDKQATKVKREFNGVFTIPTYKVPRRVDKYIRWTKDDGEIEDVREHFLENFRPSEAFIEYANTKGLDLPIFFSLNTETGKLTEFLIDNSQFPKHLRIEILSYLQQLPPVDLSIRGPYTVASGLEMESAANMAYGRRRTKKNGRYEMNVMFSDTSWKTVPGPNLSALAQAAMERNDINSALFYALGSAQFGWINCDRFPLRYNDVLVNYSVEIPSPTATVKLIFADMTSVMNGSTVGTRVNFANVPLDRTVTLLYVDPNGENPTMRFEKTVTDTDGYKILKPEKFNFEKMQQELERLSLEEGMDGYTVW